MSQAGDRDLSDSTIQLDLEYSILDEICKHHPDWHPVQFPIIAANLGLQEFWQRTKPDGTWETGDGRVIIAECYARIGALKPGHRRKLAMDVLKLISLRSAAVDPNRLRCVLIIPEELEGQLTAKDWLSAAIRQAVELEIVKLTDEQRNMLKEAVNRQAAGQARSKSTRE